ncbi:translation initiation factor IF-2-like [Peromyscus californicus insignis]|uniref:translation initiation factor IF-2-like n=1 Tax=Peromyscus californicus insignis TaxID=564181 RepID=UPI0022A69154|nr:translation initiation factor IF-2-like [Peromyscus californicus insignis]
MTLEDKFRDLVAARRDRSGGSPCGGAGPGRRLRSIPRLRASPPPGRLPAWRGARLRSTFTWSSPRPPPARPRRLRRLRGGARELVGLAKRRGGGAGVPGPAARSLPGAGGGFVCARGVLGALRLAAASLRSWPAGGSRRPGARRPLLLLRGAPSPPAALLTDGATAPTRRRHRRGFSQLLSLMLGLLRIPRGAGGGGTRAETVRWLCPIKGPAGSRGPRPLVRAWEAGRPWVGPPSGLSVTVVAGILACGPRRVCERMRGWRRR